MNKIIAVTPKDNMLVYVKFADGFSAELDVKQFLKGGISDDIKDPDIFKKVRVDEFGGISWINGFDFCPNFLREYLQPELNR
jgi:hypothetical protein